MLVENAAAGGLDVQVQTQEDVTDLPATVDAAAYCIIQEALTNVMRHAAATQVSLAIRIDGRTLHLRIADDGNTPRGAITPGSGIVGMTERARLLGGMLTTQPGPSGGFEVVAALPLKDGK